MIDIAGIQDHDLLFSTERVRADRVARQLEQRGFVGFGSSGDVDPELPPTPSFAYPGGGISNPRHRDELAAGASFWVYCFVRGMPEELAPERIWHAGQFNLAIGPYPIGEPILNVTLAEAADYTVARAAHHRQHCVVPDVARDDAGRALYTLRAAEWAELRDAFPVPDGAQVGMFDDPIQGAFALCRRAIRDELAARAVEPGDAVTVQDRMALSQLPDLIDAVNRARPVPEFCWDGGGA